MDVMDFAGVQPNAYIPAATDNTSTQPQQVAERRELVKAIQALNATEMFGENHELTFAYDRETKRPVVRIIDRQTKEVLRQIPPEYALRMAEELRSNKS
jgi:flagellar protein FlaG